MPGPADGWTGLFLTADLHRDSQISESGYLNLHYNLNLNSFRRFRGGIPERFTWALYGTCLLNLRRSAQILFRKDFVPILGD